MRASPARIMAEIRADHDLSVKAAWQVYRETRDYLRERGEKPSLAAVDRVGEVVNAIVRDVTAPPDIDFYEGEDMSDFWEITVYYDG
jgi:hypothetical protein